MNLAILFLLLQSVVTHKVTLTFDLYLPQPFCYGQCQIIGTTPTNPGWFNIYRSPQNTDGACGTFTWLNHVPQNYANGVPVPPDYRDFSVTAGKKLCYEVSFIQTPAGTPSAIETDLSAPIQVT